MSTAYKLTTTIDSSTLQSPHQKKPWSFVFDALNSSSCPLMLRVLDTIVFSKGPPWRPKYWIFTDQDNFVRKRGISKLSVDDIVKACVQSMNNTGHSAEELMVLFTQLSKPKFCERKVCFLVSKKARKLVNLLALWNWRAVADEGVELLQVYHIAGKPFDEFVYFHSYNAVGRSSIVTKRLLEAFYTEEATSVEDPVNKRIEEDTLSVMSVMEAYHSCPIVFLRLSYLVERDCIVGPSDKPRAVQLDPESTNRVSHKQRPAPVVKPTTRAKPKMNKTDPRLSIVTLSPVHFPHVPDQHHKTTQEIIADIQIRKDKYEAQKLKMRGESRKGSKRIGTSHSCVLPSVDLEQGELSVLATSVEQTRLLSPLVQPTPDSSEPSLREVLKKEQSKSPTPRMKAVQIDNPADDPDLLEIPLASAHIRRSTQDRGSECLPIISEDNSEPQLLPSLSRTESPDIQYPLISVARIDLSEYIPPPKLEPKKRSTSVTIRSQKKQKPTKIETPAPIPRQSLDQSIGIETDDPLIERFPRGEKCKGDFCGLTLVKFPNIDLQRRYSIKLKVVQLGKLLEYSPMRRPELICPREDLVELLEKEFRSQNVAVVQVFQGGKEETGKKPPAPVHSYFELLREEKLHEDIEKIGERTYAHLIQRNRKQIFYLPSASVCFSNLNKYPLKISSFAGEQTPAYRTLSPQKRLEQIRQRSSPSVPHTGLAGKQMQSQDEYAPVCFRCLVVYMNIAGVAEAGERG